MSNLLEEIAEAERQAQEQAERKRQQQEHAEAQEKAREKLTENTRLLTEKQERLTEIEAELGELAKATDLSKKDRKVKHSKLRGEMTRMEKAIHLHERQIEQANTTIDQPFEYRPPAPLPGKQSATSFVPEPVHHAGEQVPDEQLPAVGRLLRAGKQRLLAISRWEGLDQGEVEAKRLGTHLVSIVEE